MYNNKNKGLSFIEVVISISVILFISLSSYQILKSNLKLLNKIVTVHQKEKDIVSLKTLLLAHIYDKNMTDFRLIDIKDTGILLNFNKIFSNPAETDANCLIIKYYSQDEKTKKTQFIYRCFLFINNNINIFYFDSNNLPFLRESNNSILGRNFKGSFSIKNNLLSLSANDLETGDNYELLFYK